jgi:V-type H+-transporting ATPase subunit G
VQNTTFDVPSIELTVAQHASGNKKAEEEANKDAEVKLKQITEAGKKSGSKVVEDLIKAVITVEPEVPDKVQQPE